MSHISCEWGLSHMDESRACVWYTGCDGYTLDVMRHVSHAWNMTFMNVSCLIWTRHVSYQWVAYNWCLFHIMGHVSHRLWQLHTRWKRLRRRSSAQEWVILHMNGSFVVCMGHVPYERATSHRWVMFQMNELFVIYVVTDRDSMKEAASALERARMSRVLHEWVMSYMNGSCLT